MKAALLFFALLLPMGALAQGTPVSIPLNKTGPSNNAWSSALTYQQGQMVQSQGLFYVSTTFGNANNPPATTPSQWWCLS